MAGEPGRPFGGCKGLRELVDPHWWAHRRKPKRTPPPVWWQADPELKAIEQLQDIDWESHEDETEEALLLLVRLLQKPASHAQAMECYPALTRLLASNPLYQGSSLHELAQQAFSHLSRLAECVSRI